MQEKFYCECQGVLVFVDQREDLLDLYTLRRQGASGEWGLNRELEGATTTNKCTDGASIAAWKVVLNTKCGTRSLFLSSTHRKMSMTGDGVATSYNVLGLLMYSPSERKLLDYGGYKSQLTSEAEAIGAVSILDGPIVVWSEGWQLQVMYAVDHSHRIQQHTYDIRNLISDHYCLVKVNSVWPFLWADDETGIVGVDSSSVYIIFVKLEVTTEEEGASISGRSITEWVCLQVKLHSLGLAVKLLRESELIPRDYGCVSTCVAMHKNYSVGLASGDIASRNQFLVGTEYCQVVLLHQGATLQCISLKYIPRQILLMDVRT